jgi:hypothetical protein
MKSKKRVNTRALREKHDRKNAIKQKVGEKPQGSADSALRYIS